MTGRRLLESLVYSSSSSSTAVVLSAAASALSPACLSFYIMSDNMLHYASFLGRHTGHYLGLAAFSGPFEPENQIRVPKLDVNRF